jgi:hypothetical protein
MQCSEVLDTTETRKHLAEEKKRPCILPPEKVLTRRRKNRGQNRSTTNVGGRSQKKQSERWKPWPLSLKKKNACFTSKIDTILELLWRILHTLFYRVGTVKSRIYKYRELTSTKGYTIFLSSVSFKVNISQFIKFPILEISFLQFWRHCRFYWGQDMEQEKFLKV